jgi:hypothetical protein
MTLPSENNPISLGKIQTEFGGSDPISVTEYYRSGSYVSGSGNANIPTSGALSLSNFYGKRKAVFGCTDPNASNYNPNATDSNGNCSYPPIRGCTDPSAENYNPNATENDGSCRYPSPPDDRKTYEVIGVRRYFNNTNPGMGGNPNYPAGDHYCTSEIGTPAPDGYTYEGTIANVYKTEPPSSVGLILQVIDNKDGGLSSGVMGYAFLSDPGNIPVRPIYELKSPEGKSDIMWSGASEENGYVCTNSDKRPLFYAPQGSLTV